VHTGISSTSGCEIKFCPTLFLCIRLPGAVSTYKILETMAKSSNLAEVPFAIHIAQTLLGKQRSKIIADPQVAETEYCKVVNALLFTEPTENENHPESSFQSSVVVKVFDTLVHCYFEDQDVCEWSAIYVKDEEKAENYRRLIDRTYKQLPGEKNSWINNKDKSIISYFYDDQNQRYVIGFLMVELEQSTQLWLQAIAQNHGIN